MADIADIPIFPLNTVLYPGGRLPLRIFETRYVDMTKACIRDNSVFGVCQILEGQETGKPAVPARVGCTARIVQWDVPAAGLFTLVTEGESVFRIQEQWSTKGGLLRANVRLQEPLEPPAALPERYKRLSRLLQEIIEKLGAEHFASPLRLNEAAWVAWRLAEMLPLERDFKLRLLEAGDPLEFLGPIEEAVRSAVKDRH
ncbi:MAG: LON peptidase substrate-binding domain-containing protein [Nevskia sp.]|nr:LON peptidase substrate-binding domain-containing protein [Nevskia sp.]